MPKVKKSDENTDGVSTMQQSVDEWLTDGHPNPEFYPKDGDGLEGFQAALDARNLWGDYFGKIYRIKPLRNAEDKPPRLEKFANTLTIDYIRKTYGGRKFSVWLSRRVGTKDQMVGKFHVDVEAPPIWHDESDPLDAAGKAAAGNAQAGTSPLTDKLVGDLIEQRDKAQGNDAGEALDRAVEIVNKGANASIDILVEQAKKAGGGNNEIMHTLVNKLLDRLDQKPASNSLMDKFLEAMIAKMLTPADPAAEITKWLAVTDSLRGSGGGGRSRSDWTEVALEFVRNNPDLVKSAAELLKTGLSARGPAGMPPARPALPGPTQRPTGPLPPGVAPQNAAQPGSAPSPESRDANPGIQQITNEQAEQIVIIRVKQVLVQMLEAGEPGDDAALVAKTMHPLFAADLAGVLKDNPVSLKDDPILGRAIQHPNVLEFAKEYVAYFDQEDDAGEGNAAPAPPPPAIH